ncbi:hypothetical protein OQ968_18715 [Mycobacterium sp. 663a-19]|uniref:hypothetical protein n=1 Tax=Mycobacterium sp. 663a-19 TaxID=2986148 RepID=UPI002D1E7975|nr:hypothetical protein [Mycobacterium sp. 663a-19]MEB3983289.1 hypothetical protein [Mycobacterium sp. 663a-19]
MLRPAIGRKDGGVAECGRENRELDQGRDPRAPPLSRIGGDRHDRGGAQGGRVAAPSAGAVDEQRRERAVRRHVPEVEPQERRRAAR